MKSLLADVAGHAVLVNFDFKVESFVEAKTNTFVHPKTKAWLSVGQFVAFSSSFVSYVPLRQFIIVAGTICLFPGNYFTLGLCR
jgi:hypothetical protein